MESFNEVIPKFNPDEFIKFIDLTTEVLSIVPKIVIFIIIILALIVLFLMVIKFILRMKTVAYSTFLYDYRQAKKRQWRIPNAVNYYLAKYFGASGIHKVQLETRHKTSYRCKEREKYEEAVQEGFKNINDVMAACLRFDKDKIYEISKRLDAYTEELSSWMERGKGKGRGNPKVEIQFDDDFFKAEWRSFSSFIWLF